MRLLPGLAILTIACPAAQAHFIWLEPVKEDDGTTTVQVYFGEDASPDDPAHLSRIRSIRLYHVTGEDKPTALELTATDQGLSSSVADDDGRSLFIASHDMGVSDRGDVKFRLKYYAKAGPTITSQTWQRTVTSDDLRLDVIPSFQKGQVTVVVHFDGKPVAGVEVKASGPGMNDFAGETNTHGQVKFMMADAGLYSIRARQIEAVAGELDGKSYPETRHYTTVAVHVPQPLSTVDSRKLTTINVPTTSFGAALMSDHLYVYGGHTGSAHAYSTASQGSVLSQLNLKTAEWKTLIDGPPLQGLSLVAYNGSLYRVGGFTAKNAEGEEHDLWSQALVARFDPQKKSWTELPPLPEPRSSFDAAVLGDAIYVVGGWSMQGEAESLWHETAWKLDLTQSTRVWQPLPSPPFQRRALAVATHNGKLYAIGGMQKDGRPTRRTDVFDTDSEQWGRGPDILGDDGLTGFGVSAFATGGRLYVSTIKGTLQRLSEDGREWVMVGKTPTARFFHRMLPLDDEHLLVVGGTNMDSGKFGEIEILFVAP